MSQDISKTRSGNDAVPMYNRVVLNIPHASPVLPFGTGGWDEGIRGEIDRWTDWYTDWLFASASRLDPRIVPVVYPFSRFFCDVERLENDPLESVGQGIVYERFGALRRMVPAGKRTFAMQTYREHHDRLRKAITGDRTLLVDCHSFLSDLSDVEVCIGVNDDWSRPDEAVLESVLDHFRKEGYRTEINIPYSNSVSPECGVRYASLMIELNKGLYMDADGILLESRASRLRAVLEDCFRAMLGNETEKVAMYGR